MLIDCDRCVIRGAACSDCVMTVLLDRPCQRHEIGAEEFRALQVLAGARLVPPLRLQEALPRAS